MRAVSYHTQCCKPEILTAGSGELGRYDAATGALELPMHSGVQMASVRLQAGDSKVWSKKEEAQ